MKKVAEVGGIYITRNGAVLQFARASKIDISDWDISPSEEMYTVEWDKDPKEVKARIGELGNIIHKRTPALESIAIASYGPFESLVNGVIRERFAHPPLDGISLKKEFRKYIGEDDKKPRLTFYTDAMALAIGTAIDKKIGMGEILGFLAVTSGVGLGIVRGRTVHETALHPEIGLMPLRFKNNDPMKKILEKSKKEGLFEYSGGLEELAANKSVAKRIASYCNDTPENISAEERAAYETEALKLRAYYLAQACLALVTINPPHHIVIGADIDPKFNTAALVSKYFNDFIDEREKDGQPMFDYDRLRKPGFITSIRKDCRPSTIGAIGMCHAAASVSNSDTGTVIESAFHQ